MHQRLSRVSPLAVPVMLEIGREPVFGEAQEDLIAEAAGEMIEEAGGTDRVGNGLERAELPINDAAGRAAGDG